MEVPLAVGVPVSLVFHAEVLQTAGANQSTQGPQFEKEARASVSFLAPTVIPSGVRAGVHRQASSESLAAASA